MLSKFKLLKKSVFKPTKNYLPIVGRFIDGTDKSNFELLGLLPFLTPTSLMPLLQFDFPLTSESAKKCQHSLQKDNATIQSKFFGLWKYQDLKLSSELQNFQ